jgi:deazaflavin-dependent oxidoreductase (nitroreductase family)
VGGEIFGQPVILLTTTGRTSGIRRTKPLLAMRDGAAWIVVGSRGGTREHPQWYRNLVAYRDDPDRLVPPTVEAADNVTTSVESEDLTGADLAEWWTRLVAVYPKFQAYQDRTRGRTIPVIRLTPKPLTP